MTDVGGLAKGKGAEPCIVFGPVHSRRLGRSLGVDNLRGARCSYACCYCEVGDRVVPQRSRQRFYEPGTIVEAVRVALGGVEEPIDHITIVPTGEPTLDASLGETIVALKELDLPVAVFTNGSLLSRDDVRRELGLADLVSVKVDAADRATWRTLDGPYDGLDFELVTQGVRVFAATFAGRLMTETTLVGGVNTGRNQLEAIADLVSGLGVERAYLVLGPGAQPFADRAEEVFAQRVARVAQVDPDADRPAGRRLYLRRRLSQGHKTARAALEERGSRRI